MFERGKITYRSKRNAKRMITVFFFIVSHLTVLFPLGVCSIFNIIIRNFKWNAASKKKNMMKYCYFITYDAINIITIQILWRPKKREIFNWLTFTYFFSHFFWLFSPIFSVALCFMVDVHIVCVDLLCFRRLCSRRERTIWSKLRLFRLLSIWYFAHKSTTTKLKIGCLDFLNKKTTKISNFFKIFHSFWFSPNACLYTESQI